MHVAYYYNQPQRLPADHDNNNPYGELLCRALERLGHTVKFEIGLTPEFLGQNRQHCEVLHLNWPHYMYYDADGERMHRQMRDFVASLEVARELNYKVVWTAHNLYPHNRRHQEIDHECRLEICRLATAVIVHCDVAATAVRRQFNRPHNLFVIPHGHFMGVYEADVTRELARKRLEIPGEDFVYAFFGNLQRYKGVERLIDEFSKLPDEDAWLLITGGGCSEYLDQIHRHAGGRKRLRLRTYERAPSSDLVLVLQAADVIVLPFLDTMTSGTFILALSWSRPVIAPAVGCLPSTAAPGAGILFQPGDTDALQTALRDIRTWDLTAAAGAARSSMSRLDWDEIAKLTVAAYQAE